MMYPFMTLDDNTEIVHKKIPAFRRGFFVLFCFPRLVHIL